MATIQQVFESLNESISALLIAKGNFTAHEALVRGHPDVNPQLHQTVVDGMHLWAENVRSFVMGKFKELQTARPDKFQQLATSVKTEPDARLYKLKVLQNAQQQFQVAWTQQDREVKAVVVRVKSSEVDVEIKKAVQQLYGRVVNGQTVVPVNPKAVVHVMSSDNAWPSVPSAYKKWKQKNETQLIQNAVTQSGGLASQQQAAAHVGKLPEEWWRLQFVNANRDKLKAEANRRICAAIANANEGRHAFQVRVTVHCTAWPGVRFKFVGGQVSLVMTG